MRNDLTTGSVWKTVVRFSLPYLLSYFLQTLYGMADLFIIGQFEGVASTTAVSVGSQVMHMLTVMIVGLAMGSTVSIGQAVGARDARRAGRSIGNTATLFLGLSLVLTALLLLLVDPIVALMSTPEAAAEGTADYLTICFLGIPFITAYNIISSIFRGLGDSRSPMYFIAVACAANIGLDYLFMGGLGLGPSGAALGTTLSQTVLLITVIANGRGLSDAAAVGIVEKIISFLFLVPSSMLSAVSALEAQSVGAGKEDRARQILRCAICIAVGFGLCAAAVTQVFAEPVVGLFTDPQDGAAVIRLGGQYLRGYVWDCVFAGVHFSFSGYFCACGRSSLSFLHNVIAIVLVRVPGAYLTSALFPDTLLPMGLATATGSLVSVLVCVAAYQLVCRRGGHGGTKAFSDR